MVDELFTAQLIGLHILPNLLRGHREGIHVAVVGMAIVEDYVASLHLCAIDRLVAHGFRDEAVKFADHLVASVGVNVPLAQRVSDLSMPDLTSDHLWVDVLVGNDVHVVPPAVEKIVIPLVVHAHIKHVHRGQVAGCRRANHLTVVDNTEVRCAHRVQMLIPFVVDKDDLSLPVTLTHVLLDVLLASGAHMRADHRHEVVEGAGLWGERCRC